jgi:hypothetical protein
MNPTPITFKNVYLAADIPHLGDVEWESFSSSGTAYALVHVQTLIQDLEDLGGIEAFHKSLKKTLKSLPKDAMIAFTGW